MPPTGIRSSDRSGVAAPSRENTYGQGGVRLIFSRTVERSWLTVTCNRSPFGGTGSVTSFAGRDGVTMARCTAAADAGSVHRNWPDGPLCAGARGDCAVQYQISAPASGAPDGVVSHPVTRRVVSTTSVTSATEDSETSTRAVFDIHVSLSARTLYCASARPTTSNVPSSATRIPRKVSGPSIWTATSAAGWPLRSTTLPRIAPAGISMSTTLGPSSRASTSISFRVKYSVLPERASTYHLPACGSTVSNAPSTSVSTPMLSPCIVLHFIATCTGSSPSVTLPRTATASM